MSLYDRVSASLSAQGLLGSLQSGAGAAISGAVSGATNALGGGALANAVTSKLGGMATNAAANLVNKHLPLPAQWAMNVGGGAVGDIMAGNFEGAGLRLLEEGALEKLLSLAGGATAQSAYWGTPTPVFGGITPSEAMHILEDMGDQKLAKKNLFLLEVSSPLMGDVSQRLNMFCTELDYSPLTISGEKRRVGAASVDIVQSAEPVDLRMTTMDDKLGTVKRWFEAHCSAAAAADGTVGVPGAYAIKIKIVHAFITQGSNWGGYKNIGLFRPANLEVSLSRREDALQELQLTFAQLDTFMEP